MISTIHIFNEKPLGLRLGSRNGVVYVYKIEKSKPKPSDKSLSALEEARYKKVLSLIGKRILKIQELDARLYDLGDIKKLLDEAKLPIYMTFGESIDQYEKLEQDSLNLRSHVKYFSEMITQPSTVYSSMDAQRMTLLFFSYFALELLGCDNLDNVSKLSKNDLIDWIYSQQIIGNSKSFHVNSKLSGFRGGSFLGVPFGNKNCKNGSDVNRWDRVNLASTHNAICLLIKLGDNLERLNRQGIISSLSHLQNSKSGLFASMYDGEEDLRFLYCACVISYLLNDWSGVNKELAVNYISQCQRYDGGIGFSDSLESHGGSTFLGVASLALMNSLNDKHINFSSLLRWCIMNQGNGYKGRPGKPCDTCYSFWIGSVISMMSRANNTGDLEEYRHNKDKKFYKMTSCRSNRLFTLQCQSGFGGFSKYPQIPYGDIMHGYMGLVGLTMYQSPFDKSCHFQSKQCKQIFPLTSCTVSRKDIQQHQTKL